MKSRILCLSLACLTSASSLAMAQPASDAAQQQYQAQQQQYQQQQQQYQAQQQQFQNAQAQSDRDQASYDAQRRAYRRARDEYDRLHGAGAFVVYYSAHPREYDDLYGPGAFERDFGAPVRIAGPPPPPGEYFARYHDSPCEQKKSANTAAGGVLGALAGGALGTMIGLGPGRAGGLIIGAVLGGVVGGSIGASTVKCDARGYYYGYNETFPYREPTDWRGPSGHYDRTYYESHGCRLAVSPVHYEDSDQYRYVRVCPDEDNRYRFAD